MLKFEYIYLKCRKSAIKLNYNFKCPESKTPFTGCAIGYGVIGKYDGPKWLLRNQ